MHPVSVDDSAVTGRKAGRHRFAELTDEPLSAKETVAALLGTLLALSVFVAVLMTVLT